MNTISPQALLLVALGGSLGAVSRHLVSVAALELLGAGWPWGTLTVNVLGSAAIGIAAGAGLEGPGRLLLVTGFLGGFTTFSAFSLETGTLFARSAPLAVLYVAASVALGLGAFGLGLWLMRR
ncbi:CrcB family protein [Roseomonas sp. AR75]|uniref:fluoride efflux transporter FluC n=1 Tax=Roseomonas sp. AR75 TaxID=2562311 RepID=UPI0010BFA8DC|nr:CrcB family protein [Roseomonas sp. AR75]